MFSVVVIADPLELAQASVAGDDIFERRPKLRAAWYPVARPRKGSLSAAWFARMQAAGFEFGLARKVGKP